MQPKSGDAGEVDRTIEERLEHVKGLPPAALRVCEIDQRQPAEAVAGAIGFLRERGVV